MPESARLIAEIRHFNRFYTRTLGLLDETLTNSAFTLAERGSFRACHRHSPASHIAGMRGFLADSLHLNAGPASPDRRGIPHRRRLFGPDLEEVRRCWLPRSDRSRRRRRRILSLTAAGATALEALQAAANIDIGGWSRCPDGDARELGGAMQAVPMLGGDAAAGCPLRPHDIGDVGWVIERQARLYADDMAGTRNMRRWCAKSAPHSCAILCRARSSAGSPSGRENAWAPYSWCGEATRRPIAVLHVERSARGLGIGGKLVAMRRAARKLRLPRLMLWTNDVLVDARRLYERAGFTLAGEGSPPLLRQGSQRPELGAGALGFAGSGSLSPSKGRAIAYGIAKSLQRVGTYTKRLKGSFDQGIGDQIKPETDKGIKPRNDSDGRFSQRPAKCMENKDNRHMRLPVPLKGEMVRSARGGRCGSARRKHYVATGRGDPTRRLRRHPRLKGREPPHQCRCQTPPPLPPDPLPRR